MTYKDFNKQALNFYLSRASSSFFTFSIDHSELSAIVSDNNIPKFKRLDSDWTLLLREEDGIPQYFGLIALQCYAGTLMEDDNFISDRVYNARLLQVLQLTNVEAQTLYKDGNPDETAQELIWFAAKDYLFANYGLKLSIPERRIFSRRYVQYPLSQVLLNNEDLKQFTSFFSEHFIPLENIPFDFFKERLWKWIPGRISSKCLKRLSEEDKTEKCLEQIFNYYQRWEGNIYNKGIPEQIRPNNHLDKKSYKPRVLLSIFEETPKFLLDNMEISANEILQINNYFYFHKGIMLFNPIEDYDDDYEDSRFLIKTNDDCYILIDPLSDKALFSYLQSHSVGMNYLQSGIWLFRFKFENPLVDCLDRYVYTINPVQLYSGIKLKYNNTFLTGFGPSIEYTKPYQIFHNSRPIQYEPETAMPGQYLIRTSNHRDFIFHIVDSPKDTFVFNRNIGWNLANLSVSANPSMEGYMIKAFSSNKTHSIRKWIDIQISLVHDTNTQPNISLRILQNAGIQKYKNQRST